MTRLLKGLSKALSLILVLLLAALGLVGTGSSAKAQGHTVTLTWTWPTTRGDGSALALSAIGSITIFDSFTPVPGAPGTAITCNAGTFPPTATTGSCTTGVLAAGLHGFTAQVFDTSSPPLAGADSVTVSVTVPLSGPAAVTNLAGKLN